MKMWRGTIEQRDAVAYAFLSALAMAVASHASDAMETSSRPIDDVFMLYLDLDQWSRDVRSLTHKNR
jgi:hypothetical protein